MTCNIDFFQKDCEKIDAKCVNAFTEISLNPDEPTLLTESSSWNDTTIDLTPAVKAAETMTYLKLAPDNNPHSLEYIGEDGDPQCIHGDDLSRIISMTKLKDVDQTTAPVTGDVYLYDGTKFVTFNLNQAIANLGNLITQLGNRITGLEAITDNHTNQINDLRSRMTTAEGNITNLGNRMSTAEGNITNLTNRMGTAEGNITNLQTTVGALQTTLTPPANAPAGIKVAWGNINLYSDNTNTGLKTSGLYTHDLNTNITNDERFA